MPASPESLELTFDLDTLELGDMEILEDVTGRPPMELIEDLQRRSDEDSAPDFKVLMAIVLINLRRENPNATLDDVRHTKFAQLKFKQPAVPVDPTEPPVAAPGPNPSSALDGGDDAPSQ